MRDQPSNISDSFASPTNDKRDHINGFVSEQLVGMQKRRETKDGHEDCGSRQRGLVVIIDKIG